MNIKTQQFLVLGISKSGYSASKLLLELNGKCYVYEEHNSPKIRECVEELVSLGAVLVNNEDIEAVTDLIDVLVISPGVKINHEVAVLCKQKGKRIISELEFGYFSLFPEIIAVTGTNGKTTTVNLINEIYKMNNQKSLMLGNIGEPVTGMHQSIDINTVCVTEVSSFQLESTTMLCPHISCILNISPDHLERHYTMENYVFLKKRIFRNQRESEYTVLNHDDETVKNFNTETLGKVVWVSKKDKVNGAYCQDKKLYFFDEYICDEDELTLKGEHNLENVLFAIAVAKIDKIDNATIKKALTSFKGIKHRIEFVDEINGVKFYNDSKSTNTASTISAIKTVSEPKILLLGGKEKGEDYTNLLENIINSNVKKIIVYGEARFNFLKCALKLNYNFISLTENFYQAVKMSAIFADIGDAVLLSPGCSSLDEFSCFEERGNEFIKFVESLK